MSRNRKTVPKGLHRQIRHSGFKETIKVYDEEDLMHLIEKQNDFFFLVLDGVQDPHNLGACLRTCDGVGVNGVIVPRDHAVSVTDTVRNISCGGAENIPVYRVKNLSKSLEMIKESGIRIVGTEDETTRSIYDIDLTGSLAIVLGAEGHGMKKKTRECCDEVVKIPMRGEVPCLNVSVATGVCLYEALRQRLSLQKF